MSQYMNNEFFVTRYNVCPMHFTPTGRANFYTILINRLAVYFTRASGLYTSSQTSLSTRISLSLLKHKPIMKTRGLTVNW